MASVLFLLIYKAAHHTIHLSLVFHWNYETWAYDGYLAIYATNYIC
jgi:hypothetical protein